MAKTSRPLTEAEEMTESLCEAVAGSGTYMLNGQTQMQVEVLRDLLADLAKEVAIGGESTDSSMSSGRDTVDGFRTLTLWRP